MNALAVSLLLASTLARAVVISDEQAACSSHAAGDACGTGGTCVTETCTRQHPGQPATSWDCLVCRPGRGAASGAGSGSSSLIIGIVVAGVLIAGGVGFAYSRRGKGPV